MVALTVLRYTYWSDDGALLPKPLLVSPKKSSKYEVHHRNSNTFDVRLKNLAIVSKPLHWKCTAGFVLPEPVCGWGKSS